MFIYPLFFSLEIEKKEHHKEITNTSSRPKNRHGEKKKTINGGFG